MRIGASSGSGLARQGWRRVRLEKEIDDQVGVRGRVVTNRAMAVFRAQRGVFRPVERALAGARPAVRPVPLEHSSQVHTPTATPRGGGALREHGVVTHPRRRDRHVRSSSARRPGAPSAVQVELL
jgi:hypothetical protein